MKGQLASFRKRHAKELLREKTEKVSTSARNQIEPNKIYFHRCPDDSKYFRTIRIQKNPFTNALSPQISNPVAGEPTPEMDEISIHALRRLMRCNSN
tara:strand:+ start:174 stop:464 length:291 start_codon:yes stop_codon:yes gene_type:complete